MNEPPSPTVGTEPAINSAPTGVAVFADDFKTIRSLAERDNTNIVHWSEFDAGGHYAALEVPELVVSDLRTFLSGSSAGTARAFRRWVWVAWACPTSTGGQTTSGRSRPRWSRSAR